MNKVSFSLFLFPVTIFFLGGCGRVPNLPEDSPSLAQKIAECAQLPPSEDREEFYRQYRQLLPQREWFVIVDKTHILDKKYKPKDLIFNPPFPVLRKEVLSQVKKMYSAAAEKQVLLQAFSGYRSFFHQQVLNEKTPNNPYLAQPGTSQHQLGSAIDFEIGYNEGQPPSPTQIWLEEHAPKYGFSLSYPREAEDETGYPYEPWHYRYITVEGVSFQDTFFGGSQHKMLYFWEKCPPENFI